MPEASAPSRRTIRIASRVVTASPDLVVVRRLPDSAWSRPDGAAGRAPVCPGSGFHWGIPRRGDRLLAVWATRRARPCPELRWTLVALLFVICWFAFNVHYAAQDVYNTRDPATYTITGEWLLHHGSLQIQTYPEIFGTPPGNSVASAGPALH